MPPSQGILDKAQQVKQEVDDFYQALLDAAEAFLMSRQEAAKAASAHQRRHENVPPRERPRLPPDSTDDVAVIGFWWPESKHTIIVCSQNGMNMIREIADCGPQLMRHANRWQHKRKHVGIWDRFLEHCAQQIQMVAAGRPTRHIRFEPGAELEQVRQDMTALCQAIQENLNLLRRNYGGCDPDVTPRDAQQVGVDLGRVEPQVFGDNEAEARMASYLMRNQVAGPVHFYGNWSPCGGCSQSLRWLSYLYGRRRPPGREPGVPFRWRVGWVFYGLEYQAQNNDFHRPSLERATEWQGIAGFQPL